jgi:hypothetical protein
MDWLTQFLNDKNEAMQLKNWQMILLVVFFIAAALGIIFMPLGHHS